jgi:hypothetical protein
MSNTDNSVPAVQAAAPIAHAGDMVYDPSRFEHSWRLAGMFHASGMVPKHLNREACMVGVQMAEQLNLNPLMVLQNIYSVHGTIGWSSKFLIALANRSDAFKGAIQWTVAGTGRDMAVTAWAVHADTDERVEFTVSMATAQAEGWTKNSKYKTMPELMLRYRAAALLVRLYAPETLMGLPMADEVRDVRAAAAPPPEKAALADALGLPNDIEAEIVEDELPWQESYRRALQAESDRLGAGKFLAVTEGWGPDKCASEMSAEQMDRLLNDLKAVQA